MDPRDIYPTCVLKVNLGCCEACVVAVKKLLSTIDGVYGFEIDSEKGLVIVVGRADPQLLVDLIRQRKKKAEVVSYENPTTDAKTKDSNIPRKYGDLDSKPTKENKKKHCCGDPKGFKKEDIFRHHESDDSHEIEAYVPPKPSLLDTCRDPYCKSHNPKPVIIRATDIAPKVMFLPPMNRPGFLPPPPRFLPPHPGPHYPSSNRNYSEDHRYRLPHIEPIVYDRPLSQYDPWYHQRPPPQYDQWSYQRPPLPLPPLYGHHGGKHAYTGHY